MGKKSRTRVDQCLDCNGSEVSDGLVSMVTAWPSFVKPGLDGIRIRALRRANRCDCGSPGAKLWEWGTNLKQKNRFFNMAVLLSCLVMCVQHVEHDSVPDKVRFIHHSLFQVRLCPYSQDIRHRPVNRRLTVWPWKMATSRSQRTFSEKYIHSSGCHLASNCSSALWSMSVPARERCITPQPTESTTMTEMLRLVNVTPLGCMQVSTHTARGFSPSVAASKCMFPHQAPGSEKHFLPSSSSSVINRSIRSIAITPNNFYPLDTFSYGSQHPPQKYHHNPQLMNWSFMCKDLWGEKCVTWIKSSEPVTSASIHAAAVPTPMLEIFLNNLIFLVLIY